MSEYRNLNSRLESKLNEVMDTETIGKNGMKIKKAKKRDFVKLTVGLLVLVTVFMACNKDKDKEDENKGKWVQKANYPGAAVANAVAFSINGKIYVGKDDFFEYDPATNKWTEKHYFPGNNLVCGMCFVADNKAYVVGSQYALWEYNPVTDTWIAKSTCPISSGDNVSFVFGISNKGYIGSTHFHSGLYSWWITNEALYEYNNATDTWKECTEFPNNATANTIVSNQSEENAYSIGGYTSGDHASSEDYFYRYNPLTDRWTERAAFPVKTRGSIAFCKDGIIYAGLGKDYYSSKYAISSTWRNKDHNNIYKYDSGNNSWSLETEAPMKGEGKIAVICNGKLYVGLGENIEFWEYTF